MEKRATRFAALCVGHPTKQIAEATESYRGTVARWKSSRSLPDQGKFTALATCLGVSLEAICEAVAADLANRA